MIDDPLKQFEVKAIFSLELFGMHFDVTNAAIAMVGALSLSVLLLMPIFIARRGEVSRASAFSEVLYSVVFAMVEETAGLKAKKFLPLILTLFLFVLSCNLVGMFPGSFTATSHIAVTFSIAIAVFIFVTVLGFVRHGLGYLALFLPKGVPIFMAPLLVLIELFAYLARPVSLSIRLAANMTAGHIVLKVLAAFTAASGLLGIFPFSLLTILTGFEIFVSVLQAYIFSILACVYLNDALNLH